MGNNYCANAQVRTRGGARHTGLPDRGLTDPGCTLQQQARCPRRQRVKKRCHRGQLAVAPDHAAGIGHKRPLSRVTGNDTQPRQAQAPQSPYPLSRTDVPWSAPKAYPRTAPRVRLITQAIHGQGRRCLALFTLLLTVRLSGHQVMIDGHALSPPLSFVAAIPAWPGAAVQAGAPAAKRGRTTRTVGGHLMRPPRSRNVAEHRATAAPNPPIGVAAGRASVVGVTTQE